MFWQWDLMKTSGYLNHSQKVAPLFADAAVLLGSIQKMVSLNEENKNVEFKLAGTTDNTYVILKSKGWYGELHMQFVSM